MEILVGLFLIYAIYSVSKARNSSKKKQREPESPRVQSGIKRPQDVEVKGRVKRKFKPAKWYSASQYVAIQAYDIPGGLIYVGEDLPESSGQVNDACLINPRLKATFAEPSEGGDEMGYWPYYEGLSPKCRGAYLKWLATGRCNPEAYIGYVFLFFYGLERRIFKDGRNGGVSDQERTEIVKEVIRLLSVYGESSSFRGYARSFLAMEWALYQSDKPVPDYLDVTDRHCSKAFQMALAKQVASGTPIPADMALRWGTVHPEYGLRTPARRCVKEFRNLFQQRYLEKYAEGLFIKPNKKRLAFDYCPASPSVQHYHLKVDNLPNPFDLTGPMKKIRAIIEDCTTDLEPYSRFLGRKGNDPKSLDALALLPRELAVEDIRIREVRSHLTQICSEGVELLSVEKLYGFLNKTPPLQVNKKESQALTIVIEAAGFGIAPDPRFHNVKLNLDGKAVLFSKGHGKDFHPSVAFKTLTTILRLGATVSQIDGELSPAEEAILKNLVNCDRELTQIEKDSLLAFLHWCLHTPQGTAGIKKSLAEVSTTEKTAISRILISVAQADGRIDPKEIKQLEKFYTALGLNKEQVTGDLHALAAADEPVTVGLRDSEKTFSIPSQTPAPVVTTGFVLNEELIRIREEETRHVKGVLENIFADETEEAEEIIEAEPSSGESDPLSTLDEAHQNFFHSLLKQETWDRSALHEIGEGLGLMVDGAMEDINEWAFDRANAPLIDDGDPVYVDLELAREIMNDC